VHLFPELVQLLLQVRGSRFKISRLRPIGRVQRIQIALNAFVDLLHPLLKLVWRKVLVPVIDGFELATAMQLKTNK